MERQLDAPAARTAEVAGRAQGHRGPAQRRTPRAIHGETRVEGVELTDGRADRCRRGDLRGGHPAECRAGEGRRHSRQSRHRRRRPSADRRAGHLRASANAPSIAASATAWSSRPTSRRVCWRGIWPGGSRCLRRQCRCDQSEGLRRQRVLRRRFHGRAGQRNHRAQRYQARHLQEARDIGRPADRRGADRRYRRMRSGISN